MVETFFNNRNLLTRLMPSATGKTVISVKIGFEIAFKTCLVSRFSATGKTVISEIAFAGNLECLQQKTTKL